MRTIEWTSQFKRDYKRESKGQHRITLDDNLFPIVDCLANDQLIDSRHRDHPLSGDWKDHRNCHIKPCWYRLKTDHLCRLKIDQGI